MGSSWDLSWLRCSVVLTTNLKSLFLIYTTIVSIRRIHLDYASMVIFSYECML